MQLLKVAMLEDTKRDWRGRRSRPTMVTVGENTKLHTDNTDTTDDH